MKTQTVATLLSSNEKKSLQIKVRAYMDEGQLYLSMSEAELDRAEIFLEENCVSGVYFDPSITPESYAKWASEVNGVTLYK